MNRIGLTHTGPIVGSGSRGDIYDTATALPSMRETLSGWGSPLVLDIIRKELKDRRVVEGDAVKVQTQGVLQPLQGRRLEIKPEGERAWDWQELHCTPDVQLHPDDVVIIKNVRYRVMNERGYNSYGFVQYELLQDYQNGGL